MDDFHYVVAIAGYVGAVLALVAAWLAWLLGENQSMSGQDQAKVILVFAGALVVALVLALLSSILIRLIE